MSAVVEAYRRRPRSWVLMTAIADVPLRIGVTHRPGVPPFLRQRAWLDDSDHARNGAAGQDPRRGGLDHEGRTDTR